MARTPGKTNSVISLKVTLRNIRPPVWRRLSMPGGMTLGDLHLAIQAAMGWEGQHLHQFDIDGRHYGEPRAVDDVADEESVILNTLARSGVARFSYTYDFGDNWEHSVVIEKKHPAADAPLHPACVAGKRNCPPEDCGGPWGYQLMLAALADPDHPEHADQIEWIGEDFEPEEFSVIGTNAIMAARFGRP